MPAPMGEAPAPVPGIADRATARAALEAAKAWLVRQEPYGQNANSAVEEFNFEEETNGHTGRKYAWMNAAHAMAANINRAHKDQARPEGPHPLAKVMKAASRRIWGKQ